MAAQWKRVVTVYSYAPTLIGYLADRHKAAEHLPIADGSLMDSSAVLTVTAGFSVDILSAGGGLAGLSCASLPGGTAALSFWRFVDGSSAGGLSMDGGLVELRSD